MPVASVDRRETPIDLSAANHAVSGTSGTWTEVTPAAFDLNSASNGGDNFGVQDIWPDPLRIGVAYCWTCYGGMWRTVDFGLTWAKLSTPADVMDTGKPWGSAVASDGRTLYATIGTSENGSPVAKRCVHWSKDNGVSWGRSTAGLASADPYNVSIDPSDNNHLLVMTHDDDVLYESLDGGRTLTDMGQVLDGANSASLSSYVHFIDSSTALVISQAGGIASDIGMFKCVKSGGSWAFTRVHSTLVHEHGAHQIYIDRVNNWIYVPAEAGLYRSAANGDLTSWTQVHSAFPKGVIAGTTTTLYTMRCFPTAGTLDPKIYTSPRTDGANWSAVTQPAGMDNGGKTLCAMSDGNRWVLLAGCWLQGIWRYVE